MQSRILYIILCFFIVELSAQEIDTIKLNYNNLLTENLALKEYQPNTNAGITDFFQSYNSEKKSVGKALLLSLLIPGAGEYYLGETSYTKLFLGIELAGWGTIFFNRYYYDTLVKDYQSYASLHAGINSTNKDDQYWIDVGKHDNIYSYNNTRVNQRRIEELYDENDINFWRWDSKKNRYTYDAKRLKSVSIKDREIYFTIGILVNHLVSAVNAVRLARRYNKNLAQNSFNYRFVVNAFEPQNKYFGLTLSKSF